MSSSTPPSSPDPTPKKRKRTDDTIAEELEIDVNLPEPPSRKALRKAKKQKKDSNGTSKPTPTDEEQATPTTKKPERSPHSIWIGNLPWTCDRDALRAFLIEHAGGAIAADDITRIHMPAPAAPPRNWTGSGKPRNKGFAYVDFASQQALYAALALTETMLAGRRVLIKDARNFDGRPEPAQEEGSGEAAAGKQERARQTREESDRVFVGNLGFEVTREEVQEHYGRCGEVTSVFLATFEDSGKCKGFGWVIFKEIEGARGAVRGWVKVPEDDDEEDDGDVEHEDGQATKKRPIKKVYVNRLHGRTLRCEFAESSTERYNKRFRGRGRRNDEDAADGVDDADPDANGVSVRQKGHAKYRTSSKATGEGPVRSQDFQMAPGGSIKAQGSKIVFDD